MDTRRSILDFIHHFTVAWQIQRFVALERLILPGAIFEVPERYEGREACLEFCKEPEFSWEEELVSVEWAEGTATVVLDWRRPDGRSGRDTHELKHDGVRWKLSRFVREKK